MNNAITWVEIPAKNFKRAKKFYESVFSAKLQLVPTPRGTWGMFPHQLNGAGGGCALVEGDDYEPSSKGAIVYLSGGNDLTVTLSKVEKAGGKILMEKVSNNGFGYIAFFTDTEGNKVGLHSPN